MKNQEKKAVLQIQPAYQNAAAWMELAEQGNLLFEVMEFLPDTLLGEEEACVQKRAFYQECGRVNALHGAFIDVNPASGDPAFKALSQKRCHESCILAGQIGAKYVVFHSSCFPFLRGDYLKKWADECAAFYTQLADTYGLTICIENSMDVDPTPLCELMKRTDERSVCVCLDIGHANYSGTPMETWFERLGDRIGYLHLSDNDGSFDDHFPLGQGSVDWAAVDRLWRNLGRRTPITLEVGGLDGVKDSLTFLRANGYFDLESSK